MDIIKLNAIDSTNTYLRKICAEMVMKDYTVVMADVQTNGRGQMGALWISNKGKNLTVSVFKDVSFLNIEQHFYISIVTSLALLKTLNSFSVSKLSIKWPNDILSENKKICGILIENVIKQQSFNASIIGIGLNVNQTEFQNLPRASSIRLVTGRVFNRDEILTELVKNLKSYFTKLKHGDLIDLKAEYEKHLFRKGKASTFQDIDGKLFSGIIKEISQNGNLQVVLEEDIIKEFDLKEITLLY